jgi:hypothetical protein
MADQTKPLIVMTCTPGAGHVNPITTIAKVSNHLISVLRVSNESSGANSRWLPNNRRLC